MSRKEAARAVARLYETVLHREGSAAERQAWVDRIVERRLSGTDLIFRFAAAAKREMAVQEYMIDVPDQEFIQIAHQRILGFVPYPREMARMEHRLQTFGRADLVVNIFRTWAVRGTDNPAIQLVVDHSKVLIMGTDEIIDANAWSAEHPTPLAVEQVEPATYTTVNVGQDDGIVASVITSLYGGADFIEGFLENITAQTIFDRCEVIIIDAASPDGEFEIIKPYIERFPNIVYHRTPTRIGIYEAWNVGVRMARGRYLTNANVDDLRRSDSLERQSEILDTFEFVDVVYQDFYYSFDSKATFDQVAAIGLRSRSPVITPQNLVEHNYPHNAPMWRASLHGEVGFFNESYKSAGDAEFWWRVLAADKTFFKVNDPHVAYFVNPHGISTASETPGLVEWTRLRSTLGPALVSDWLLLDRPEFEAKLADHEPDLEIADSTSWDWRSRSIEALLRNLAVASRIANPAPEEL